jgi:hypothetical protein
MNQLFISLFLLLGSPENMNPIHADPVMQIYSELEMTRPSWEVFQKAYQGYKKISRVYNLNIKKPFLTIIDLNLPSDKKRLWVIDLLHNKILFYTYTSHGKNSGELYARNFSNQSGSYQSSLGFYLTGGTYNGKNGYSMYLEGLEKGINNLARQRAIVMHGAWYATEKFIREHGRLGRSFGCPAIPPKIHQDLINAISNQTVLFIYSADDHYLHSSQYLVD